MVEVPTETRLCETCEKQIEAAKFRVHDAMCARNHFKCPKCEKNVPKCDKE